LITFGRKLGVGDVRISDLGKQYVNDVLDTNRLSYGKYSRRFEREFADIHRRKFSVLVNSGTDALRIGLAAMKEHYDWPDGSAVLVPALTFVASLNVVLQNNLRPVLVDIEPDYYGIDQTAFVRAMVEKPVAVMPVHLFGQPAFVPSPDFAARFGVRVITDSCETMFVDKCAWGDVSCFSTYACHIVNTGVGGIATTNDPKLAVLMRSLANHGRDGIYTGIDDELGQVETIKARFKFDRPGYSSRVTEFEAALGCAELARWEWNIAQRQQAAAFLIRELRNLPLGLPKERVAGEHAYMMLPLRATDRETRDRLVTHLEARGIETRYSLPLTNQPYLKALFGADVEDRYPVAKAVNETGLYIGITPWLTQDDLDYIVAAFRSFY
jgi:perosamine synthetase